MLPIYAPLELKCVKKYLQSHNTKHFPVDIETSPNQSIDEILMFRTFAKNKDYNKLESEYNSLKIQEGLDFFNSDIYLNFSERKSFIEKKILETATNNNILLNTYKIFIEETNNRENAMLQNIYNYSKENQYNQTVFLVGAGHRKSIIEKLLYFEKQSEIKLNWTMYGSK